MTSSPSRRDQSLRDERRGERKRSRPAFSVEPSSPSSGRFDVTLDNFTGPFDLLLQLISRHKLDITEVALSRVTDEFIAHIKTLRPGGSVGIPPGMSTARSGTWTRSASSWSWPRRCWT